MPDFDLPPLPFTDPAKPDTRDWAIIQWAEAHMKQGQEFLEAQLGYDKIDKATSAIFSYEGKSDASYAPTARPLSQTFVNKVSITAEDITAMLTDTRVFWNYSTNNPKYEAQARLCNKDAAAWYTSRNIDLRIGDVVRYYTVAGTGYAHLFYSRRLNDMMVEAEDPRNVIPIGPISYHTLQDCEGVIVRKARTPAWVKAEYGKDVAPDTGAQSIFGWMLRTIGAVGGGGNNVTGPLSPDRKHKDAPIPKTPTVFVNTMYLNDPRTNPHKHDVFMGGWEADANGVLQPKNPWSYRVKPGMPLYPFKRLVIWGGGVLLYDDTSPYWHGKFPLVKLTLNPWPQSFLGKAPLWDILPLNNSLNGLLRVIDDNAAQQAQPGVVADRNVSRSEIQKFNSRTPGYKVRTNMASGKGINIVTPPTLAQSLWQHIDKIEGWIREAGGTVHIAGIANLGQIPSDDTLEKIMNSQTNGIRLRSRILEGFAVEFSEMYLWCIAEFDTIGKRVAKFGPDAVTAEDFDYQPGSFIPDDVPDGSPGDIGSTLDAMGQGGPRPAYERAKAMLLSFASVFEPSSLLNSAGQQELMKYFLLAKLGYMSCFTLLEKAGIKNFAPPGLHVPADEIGRLALQQQLGIGMVANAQGRKATDQKPPSMGENANGPIIQTS